MSSRKNNFGNKKDNNLKKNKEFNNNKNKNKGTSKNKPGRKLRGNDKPFKNIFEMEKNLLNGFPVTVDEIKNYRNAIKEVSAQVLSVGIKNYYNAERADFNFSSFFNEYTNETHQEELADFYRCFYLYYYKDIDLSYLANISHYKSQKKKIVNRALNDIKVLLDEHLIVVYEKLISEYKLYDYEQYDVPNAELKKTINKLHYCYDAIGKICETYKFLLKTTAPKNISKRTYKELKDTGCPINAFYKEGDDSYVRIQKIKHIDLGYEGALYFLKKT